MSRSEAEVPRISIIVPCYNEEGNIATTVNELLRVAGSTRHPFEIITVNDGSRDNTSRKLHELAEAHPSVIAVDLMRNFGQTQAYQVGMDLAEGDYLVLFSADLETAAEKILDVVEKLDEGYDLVNAARIRGQESARDWKSRVANRALNGISGLTIKDRGTGLKGMRRSLYKNLRLYGEWHRFVPDYASIYTDRIVEIDVPFNERVAGASSYSGRIRSLAVFLDLATVAFTLFCHRKPYLMLPGRLFGFSGLVFTGVGMLVSLYLIVGRIVWGIPLADRPLFFMGIMLAVLGVTMAMIGTLGELVMQLQQRIEYDSSHRIRSCSRKNHDWTKEDN
jgi:glycosyltransferase involved in cell wall biosynthesis